MSIEVHYLPYNQCRHITQRLYDYTGVTLCIDCGYRTNYEPRYEEKEGYVSEVNVYLSKVTNARLAASYLCRNWNKTPVQALHIARQVMESGMGYRLNNNPFSSIPEILEGDGFTLEVTDTPEIIKDRIYINTAGDLFGPTG